MNSPYMSLHILDPSQPPTSSECLVRAPTLPNKELDWTGLGVILHEAACIHGAVCTISFISFLFTISRPLL